MKTTTSLRQKPSWGSVALAYVLALAYWVSYFVKGAPSFTTHDWLKEQVFSNLIRESILTLQLPLRMSVDYYRPGVHELIANPEISLIPDFFLLGWVSNNTYFLIHWLLFFTAGFVGTTMLARKYALTSLSFLFAVVLFNCNGFIGAHISEGHIQWAGYFLLPFFFYWLSDLGDDNHQTRYKGALKLSLVLGTMFLNGSLHIAIWCLMFTAIPLVYRWDLARGIGLTIGATALIAMARLIPAAIYYPASTEFVSGYPTLTTLLDAFTFVYSPSNPTRGGTFGNLAWHEYDFFIGYIGLAFLAVGAWYYIKNKIAAVPVWWIPAAVVMFMFSLGDVYQLIPNSGIPFTTIERVGSRFFVMPFMVWLLVAAIGISCLQGRYTRHGKVALAVSFVPLLGEIFQHARKWRIQSYEFAMGTNDIPSVVLVESTDVWLPRIIAFSWSISLLSIFASALWLFKHRSK